MEAGFEEKMRKARAENTVARTRSESEGGAPCAHVAGPHGASERSSTRREDGLKVIETIRGSSVLLSTSGMDHGSIFRSSRMPFGGRCSEGTGDS